MHTIQYKLIEFFLLFIVLPISLALNYLIWVKLIIGFFGFVYIVLVLIKTKGNSFKVSKNIQWKTFWKQILIKFLGIVFITTLFVWFTNKEALFNVLLNKPKLWIFILFIYSFFSVYPQELIYRTFFFQRYKTLFTNKNLIIFINAIVFSLAHIFFRNSLVMALTFLGGILFAITFYKTRSTLLVTIEHAIYGSWLFTVGMGNMLGFPS
ncbi:MAG: CPBP family intramembrane metalloprotease [Bacteroidetes bacterium]|nr:MAG: CPBP family intramembrane metalloprotease [Bacteroidota bacterium]